MKKKTYCQIAESRCMFYSILLPGPYTPPSFGTTFPHFNRIPLLLPPSATPFSCTTQPHNLTHIEQNLRPGKISKLSIFNPTGMQLGSLTDMYLEVTSRSKWVEEPDQPAHISQTGRLQIIHLSSYLPTLSDHFLPRNRHYHHACITSQFISTILLETVKYH